MEVDLAGCVVRITGARHAIADAVADAFLANRAQVEWTDGEPVADIAILSHDLLPNGEISSSGLTQTAFGIAKAMAARGSGRIIHLISAVGTVPMRRHATFSVGTAGVAASVRVLAMTSAPHVLVNAVAAGFIQSEDGDQAGDAAMLTHVPSARSGTPADIAHAVLFLADPANTYTTGQVLVVDGGWAAGYGRNF